MVDFLLVFLREFITEMEVLEVQWDIKFVQ